MDRGAGRGSRVRSGADGRRRILGNRGEPTAGTAVGPPRSRVRRGGGWPVRRIPAAHLPDLAARQRLRPGLLASERTPAQRAKTAAVPRPADSRHGPRGHRPPQRLVPVRLGNHPPTTVLPPHHPPTPAPPPL